MAMNATFTDIVDIYWNDKGDSIVCSVHQSAVFKLIDKLGLKSPIKHCTMWMSGNNWPGGTYTITSTSVNNSTLTVNVTLNAPTYFTTTNITLPEIEEPKVKSRKATKEMRREWRHSSQGKNCRNTGRKVGKR